MTQEQGLILAILLATVAMFLWGRWRHDMVALGSLLACVLAGLIPHCLGCLGAAGPCPGACLCSGVHGAAGVAGGDICGGGRKVRSDRDTFTRQYPGPG